MANLLRINFTHGHIIKGSSSLSIEIYPVACPLDRSFTSPTWLFLKKGTRGTRRNEGEQGEMKSNYKEQRGARRNNEEQGKMKRNEEK